MPYPKNEDMPENIRSVLPDAAQSIWRNVFNVLADKGKSEVSSIRQAWGAVKNAGFVKNPHTGLWHKPTSRQTEALREAHTGVMVALYPEPALADMVAIPGGEAASELHLTLAYVGDVADLQAEAMARLPEIVQAFSVLAYPLEGVVSGVGRFMGDGTSEGQDVFYLTLDLPALPEWRQDLLDTLEAQGLPCRHDHGFSPHLTLAYLDASAPSPTMQLQPYSLRFASVHMVMGDEHRVYALRGTDGRYAEDVPVGRLLPSADDPTLAYCVLLVPWQRLGEDALPVTPSVIRDAARTCIARLRIGESALQGRDDVTLIESVITRAEEMIAGHVIPAESWLIGLWIRDGAMQSRLQAGEDMRITLDGTAFVA